MDEEEKKPEAKTGKEVGSIPNPALGIKTDLRQIQAVLSQSRQNCCVSVISLQHPNPASGGLNQCRLQINADSESRIRNTAGIGSVQCTVVHLLCQLYTVQ